MDKQSTVRMLEWVLAGTILVSVADAYNGASLIWSLISIPTLILAIMVCRKILI